MSSLDSDSREPPRYRRILSAVILLILIILAVLFITHTSEIQLPFFEQYDETQNNSQDVDQLPATPNGCIYGTIVNDSGSPLEGIQIVAQSSKGNMNSTVSDTEGKYVLSVPEETYTISASKSGYKTSVSSYMAIESNTAYEKNFMLEKIQ